MGIDRSLFKRMARDSMRGRHPGAMMVSMVYLLLTSGIILVVSLVTFQPLMRELINAAYMDLSDWEVGQLFLSRIWFLVVGLLVLLLAALFSAVVQYGYQTYVLDLARGQEAGYRNLTRGFAITGRVLGLNVMIGIFSFLWVLAIFVPAMLVIMLLGRLLFAIGLEWLGTLLMFAIYVGAWILLYSRLLRYSLANLALADDPELCTFGAINRSKELMRGRRWEFFKLCFSFIGWYLLAWCVIMAAYYVGALMLGIAIGVAAVGGGMVDSYELVIMIMNNLWVLPAVTMAGSFCYLMWLIPYVSTTVAHYYLAISTPLEQPEFYPDGSVGPGSWNGPYQGGGTPPPVSGPESYGGGRAPDSRKNPEEPF